jgi:hypothetical protein
VPACEPLRGWRIIADAAALDAAEWPPGGELLRISADDAVMFGAEAPVLDDPHAIVTPEHGFAGATLLPSEVTTLAATHIEWQLPAHRPALAQGQIAGVPAKLALRADGSALLLVACALRNELEGRLAASADGMRPA